MQLNAPTWVVKLRSGLTGLLAWYDYSWRKCYLIGEPLMSLSNRNRCISLAEQWLYGTPSEITDHSCKNHHWQVCPSWNMMQQLLRKIMGTVIMIDGCTAIGLVLWWLSHVHQSATTITPLPGEFNNINYQLYTSKRVCLWGAKACLILSLILQKANIVQIVVKRQQKDLQSLKS